MSVTAAIPGPVAVVASAEVLFLLDARLLLCIPFSVTLRWMLLLPLLLPLVVIRWSCFWMELLRRLLLVRGVATTSAHVVVLRLLLFLERLLLLPPRFGWEAMEEEEDGKDERE